MIMVTRGGLKVKGVSTVNPAGNHAQEGLSQGGELEPDRLTYSGAFLLPSYFIFSKFIILLNQN